MGRRAAGLLVVLAIPFISGRHVHSTDGIVDAVIIGLVAAAGVVSWLVTRWRVEGGTLQVDTGLLRRQKVRVPLSRIQSVDVVRPGTARVFGLAEVRVRTAGGHGGDARLAYLPGAAAERVRLSLLELAQGGSAAVAVAERLLARVDNRRLLVAVLLRSRTVGPLVLVAAFLLAAARLGHGRGSSSLAGAALVTALAAVTAFLRQLNSLASFSVAEAGDGLHVRGGLVATVAETIPRHRIQALRQIEPLVWQGLGWAQLQADVAGRQRRRGEDRAAGGQLRALLPVGTRQEAAQLLGALLPGARPGEGSAPPARARIKAPLSYHFLRAGVWPDRAAAATGRLERTSTWVPLAKVQSIRWVQGPVQRRLGLATVHLDVAGHRVGVALEDRSVGEAVELAEQLADLCRQAREAARASRATVVAQGSPLPAAG